MISPAHRCLSDGIVHLWTIGIPAPGLRVTECGLTFPTAHLAADRTGETCLRCLVAAGSRIPESSAWRD